MAQFCFYTLIVARQVVNISILALKSSSAYSSGFSSSLG